MQFLCRKALVCNGSKPFLKTNWDGFQIEWNIPLPPAVANTVEYKLWWFCCVCLFVFQSDWWMWQYRELYLSEPGLNVVSYTQPPSQVIPMYFQSMGCGRCWQWCICSEKQPLEEDLVFFQQVSWGILCPPAENSFPHTSFPGPPAVQRPGRIFSRSAIPLCFRCSHTGVNLSMVRTVATIPHMFVHGAL